MIVLINIVEFNNDQRVYVKEAPNQSLFFRTNKADQSETNGYDITEDDTGIQRVRIAFSNPEGASIPLLLAFTPNDEASDLFDYGYDGRLTNYYPNGIAFLIEERRFNIQGVGNYSSEKRYPLSIYLNDDGPISISLTELENFGEEGINVFIYDALKDSYTHLNEINFNLNLEV